MVIGPSGLEAAYRNAAITCGAMAASTLFYAAVVAVISISQAPFEGFATQSQVSTLRIALWTVAVLEAGLITVDEWHERAEGAAAQAGRLITTAVITAALAEVPAILGLVLFMLFGLRGDFYVLLALSLALQAFFFPRLDGWRAWAAEPAPGS